MPSEQCRTYEFNSAITALPEDGEFDQREHFEQVNPLFRQIMQHNGIIGCFITRYGLEIKFMPQVITEEQVEEMLQREVAAAADDADLELFPLGEDKAPYLIVPPKPKPEPYKTVTANFNTTVVAFPPSDTTPGAMDETEFARRTHTLATVLTGVDGVVEQLIQPTSASLTIDTRIISVEATQEHMLKVFLEARDPKLPFKGIFPYIGRADELQVSFEVQDA